MLLFYSPTALARNPRRWPLCVENVLSHFYIAVEGIDIVTELRGDLAPCRDMNLAGPHVIRVRIAEQEAAGSIVLAGFLVGVAPRFTTAHTLEERYLCKDLIAL